MANSLLINGNVIPIYIALGDFNSIQDIETYLNQLSPGIRLNSLTIFDNVVFLLDGWSDFAHNSDSSDYSENRKLQGILSDSQVIANARFASQYDAQFKIWELEQFSKKTTKSFLATAFPDQSNLYSNFTDILNLPFSLILFSLLGRTLKSKSDLLENFFFHITEKLKFRHALLKVICVAAAKTETSGTSRSWSVFETEISKQANIDQIKNIEGQIYNCGLFKIRKDRVQAVHDLYWEWLVGKGLLICWDNLKHHIIRNYHLRKSISLALTKDNIPNIKNIKELTGIDLAFAAVFLPLINKEISDSAKTYDEIICRIKRQMESRNAVYRYKATLAAFISEDLSIFEQALVTADGFLKNNIGHKEFKIHISSDFLFNNRELLTGLLESNESARYSLYVIKNSGEDRWAKWAEDNYFNNRIPYETAASVFLSCSSKFPKWIEKDLFQILQKEGNYFLSCAIDRGNNPELASWVWKNYELLLLNETRHSGWFHLNKTISNCGNECLFDKIVNDYNKQSERVSELISYAIKDIGGIWLSTLQEKIMKGGKCKSMLLNVTFLD